MLWPNNCYGWTKKTKRTCRTKNQSSHLNYLQLARKKATQRRVDVVKDDLYSKIV